MCIDPNCCNQALAPNDQDGAVVGDMAMLRQLTTASPTTLQAPEHLAGELSCPMPVSVAVDLVLVVLVENAANKHSLTVVLGREEVDEIDRFCIGLAPPASETR